MSLYALAGVSDYWIVNLNDRQVEVYRTQSTGGIYTDAQAYRLGETIAPLNAPGKAIAVADLFPPMKQL